MSQSLKIQYIKHWMKNFYEGKTSIIKRYSYKSINCNSRRGEKPIYIDFPPHITQKPLVENFYLIW